MAYNKTNKTRDCKGMFHAAIRLTCKNKFTIKKVVFQTIMNFPPKDFRSQFDPKYGYKTVKKRQSTTGTASTENRHASHFEQNQGPQTPYQSTSQTIKSRHFYHKTKTAYSLPTHVTPPCRKQTNRPPKNNLHPTHLLTLIWWKKRASQEQLTPTHLLTLIRWNKRVCISSNIATFIDLRINETTMYTLSSLKDTVQFHQYISYSFLCKTSLDD